jgi:hypothetical protein
MKLASRLWAENYDYFSERNFCLICSRAVGDSFCGTASAKAS